MATRTRKPRQTPDAGAESNGESTAPKTDYASLVIQSSGLAKGQGRAAGPNPLAGMLAKTAETGAPLMIPVTGPDQAKEVTNLIRRDANSTTFGARIQYQNDNGDVVEMEQATSVHFLAKEKSKRKYTIAEAKQWAHENGLIESPTDKLSSEARKAFRIANGYEKVKDAGDAGTETSAE